MLGKTIQEACWIDVGIPNSHNLHEANKVYRYERTAYENMATESCLCCTISTFHNDIITIKLHDSLTLLSLLPVLYIVMQKAVIINSFRTWRKFLAEQRMGSAGQWDPYCLRTAKLLWSDGIGWWWWRWRFNAGLAAQRPIIKPAWIHNTVHCINNKRETTTTTVQPEQTKVSNNNFIQFH